LYEQGLGVARDEKLAAEWYAKAADQGHAWAQMSLGLLYVRGRGVPQDYTKAIFWLRNAAERNERRAQYNLGWAYESGTGVPKDTLQAIAWLQQGGRCRRGARPSPPGREFYSARSGYGGAKLTHLPRSGFRRRRCSAT
jgi:TPR repeat protein